MRKNNNFQGKVSQGDQSSVFSRDWECIWKIKFPNKDTLKNEILGLKEDNLRNINDTFAILNKALQICDFLHRLVDQDTEKIRITILVSCAEAVYKINKPKETISENLIRGFFKPVRPKIDYKIRGSVGEMPYPKIFGAVEVLYLVRNDFIHNGNFGGIFFRNEKSEDYAYQQDYFYYSEKENKAQLIKVSSECCLSYNYFLNIFLEAFIKNIEKYCENNL